MMSAEYRFGSAVFIGPWTEEEARAFSERVLEVMAEEAERAIVATEARDAED